MSIHIAYHATGVAPIVRRLAAQDPSLVALDDRQINPASLIGRQQQVQQQPVPPDPALEAWRLAHELAEDFVGLGERPANARNRVTLDGISQLIRELNGLSVALAAPAPVAPPPIIIGGDPQVLIRWGSRWVGRADIEINTAQAVSDARDKRRSRQLLAGISPETWFNRADVRTPCVVRPRVHFGGNKLFVCHTPGDVQRAVGRCGPGWYASELIDKTREFRVFVLQGRVLSVSERFPGPQNDVAWNLHAGGRVVPITRRNWPLDVIKVALDAARRVNLDFTAVDLATKRNGTPIVFEVNTAPGVTTERAIERIAFAFTSLNGPAPAPINIANINHWRDALHPSLARD